MILQGIPEDVVDEIRQRTDLVGLVGEHIKLERRGKNMVGLCPFHNEKTPSFTVSPDKQLFHCFGCGASGNAFNLVMQLEKLSFPEAARFLARRVGITIDEPKKSSTGEDSLKEKIYDLNLLAARFYNYCLLKTASGSKALEYLRKRGIQEETIELFKLGYAPAEWTGFFNFAKNKGVSADLMLKAGLVSPGKDEGCYDRFRNRIIFPIFNISGRIVGFGGRALDESDKSGPKYLNSPETAVFNKSSVLYGLHLARNEIRREKKALVMEGYTDVITAYQAGIKNAVASLGTALSAEQGRILRYQAETVVTAYDADNAGEAATWRGLSILQASGCLVQVIAMPPGTDPDGFIREHGATAFVELVDESLPLMEYRLQQLRKRYDITSDRGRINYVNDLMPFLLSAVNPIEQDYYLKRASEELGVEEESLRSELRKRRKRPDRHSGKEKNDQSLQVEEINLRPAEKILISLMLQSKEIAELGRNHLQTDYFTDQKVRMIVEELWQAAERDKMVSAEKLMNHFAEAEITVLITELATEPSLQDLPPLTAKRMAEDCIRQIIYHWEELEQLDLQKKIRELEDSGSQEKIAELLREYQQKLSYKTKTLTALEKEGI
jgi:DNA primase